MEVLSAAPRSHPVGQSADRRSGPIVYRYEDAPDVLRNYREFARDAPPECCVWVDSLAAPPLPFLPEDVHGTAVLFVAPFYAGDLDTGVEVLEPLREYGDPSADAVAPTEYTASQRTLDDLYGEGMRNYWKSHNFAELPAAALDPIVEYAERFPTPSSDILVSHVGGAINDVAPEATAYPHRNTEFVVTPGARWEDPARDETCIAWVRECYDALAAHATGGTDAGNSSIQTTRNSSSTANHQDEERVQLPEQTRPTLAGPETMKQAAGRYWIRA